MEPFRQVILPNDVGSDVLAYKRTFKRMGVQDSRRLEMIASAGAAFVHCVKAIEHNHGKAVDGKCGKDVHGIVAPHFKAFERQLYRHARIRHRDPYYRNPFRLSHALTLSRTDMGVDFHGIGLICALGYSRYHGNGGHGWPGGNYMVFELLNGPHKGRFWYLAEAIESLVRNGQTVQAGDPVARFGYNAAPGRYPGIEMGWSTSTHNLTWAAHTSGYFEGQRTPAGKAFARQLRALGCRTLEDPGPGPTFV